MPLGGRRLSHGFLLVPIRVEPKLHGMCCLRGEPLRVQRRLLTFRQGRADTGRDLAGGAWSDPRAFEQRLSRSNW